MLVSYLWQHIFFPFCISFSLVLILLLLNVSDAYFHFLSFSLSKCNSNITKRHGHHRHHPNQAVWRCHWIRITFELSNKNVQLEYSVIILSSWVRAGSILYFLFLLNLLIFNLLEKGKRSQMGGAGSSFVAKWESSGQLL